MKYLYLVITITLCLMLVLNVSSYGVLEFISQKTNKILNTAQNILELGGYHDNNSGLNMPVETVNFNTLSYGSDIGLIDIRQYIMTYMMPSWAKQEGNYGNQINFECKCNVYVNYFEGTIRTASTFIGSDYNYLIPIHLTENIYSGKMIRLDYIINADLDHSDSVTHVGGYIYSVYIFPKDNNLFYFCAYGADSRGYVSSGYNSLNYLLSWSNPRNEPILQYPRGNLMGSKYIAPKLGYGNCHELVEVRLTTERIDNDKNIFKEFMKG